MKSVVLIGMKHCGKSTQGAMLAEALGLPFIDVDTAIEQLFSANTERALNCREIYKEFGQEYFRRLEAEAVARLLDDAAPRVVAFGGGAVENPFLPKEWQKLGTVVYLEAESIALYRRIEEKGLPPYLANAEDPFAEFCRITAERATGFHAAADVTFALDMSGRAADNHKKLVALLRERAI